MLLWAGHSACVSTLSRKASDAAIHCSSGGAMLAANRVEWSVHILTTNADFMGVHVVCIKRMKSMSLKGGHRGHMRSCASKYLTHQ